MALQDLQIKNFRNILFASVEASPRINLFYGDNGSGKTSLLEAIHLLGLSRSFRSSRHQPIINNDHDDTTVFGRLVSSGEHGGSGIGVSKFRDGSTQLRQGGEPLKSAAELAVNLPLLALTANTFDLVTGPPKTRRSLVDWLAFHVEPGFIDSWRSLQNTLKQRNSLLRRGKISGFDLDPWDKQLAVFAEKIHTKRKMAFKQLLESFSVFEPMFPELGPVELKYQKGWKREADYFELLCDSRETDAQRGHTQSGPHRADIKILVGGVPASEQLSRGQQKLLVSALVLAQGAAFRSYSGKSCTFLIDDLPAEFDKAHRKKVGGWLEDMAAQVFVTGIELEPLEAMWLPENENLIKKFHVKQGQIQMLSGPRCSDPNQE